MGDEPSELSGGNLSTLEKRSAIKMSTLLIIVGFVLVCAGVINLPKSEAKKRPEHGDRRIVQEGGRIWIESYQSFPGWVKKQDFDTLDAARQDKARWDEIRSEKKIVVE